MILNEDWKLKFKDFLNSEEYKHIITTIENDSKKHSIFPARENLFKAFNLCSFKDLKVVIIGQDPYYNRNSYNAPYADGLAFSYSKYNTYNDKIPPSLRNIALEISRDIHNDNVLDPIYDLSFYANQGVLLLNTALTVIENKPGSHIKLWEPFISEVFKVLNTKDNIVYMLWGNYAKKYSKLITNKTCPILYASHPSPLSANQGGWFNKNLFSTCNKILENFKKEKIKW